MKRAIALALVLASVLLLLAGCFPGEESDLKTEVVHVLYVERGGFIARTSHGVTYIKYRRADSYAEVGDSIRIDYYERDLIAAVPDKEVGGYIWTSMLLEVQQTQKIYATPSIPGK